MTSSNFGAGTSGDGSTGSGGPGNRSDPPNLADYPNHPQYDLAAIVQLVGVRPLTLWAWEQHLGIPNPHRSNDGTGATVRHYSERDLVASIWLRDQILAGAQPGDAAERLAAVQQARGDTPSGGYSSSPQGGQMGAGMRPQTTSSPLHPPLPPSRGPFSGGLSGGPMVQRGRPTITWGPAADPATLPGMVHSAPPSGPLSPGRPSGLPGASRGGTPGSSGYGLPVGRTTGPLTGNFRTQGSGATRELRTYVPQLIRAFATFDTYTANGLVDDALMTHSIETVCVGLLLPALNRVGEMWARREMTMPEEHYAINFIRGRLFAIFATTPERLEGPLTIVTCGPREMHDIGALTLATFWRRAGLRVVFLGQDMDGEALVQDANLRRPRLVCVCVQASQRVRALARIAKDIRALAAPTPLFAFSGAVFTRNPELQRRVSGVYLGDDPATATWHAMRLLGIDPSNPNASAPQPPTASAPEHAG